MTPMPTRGWDRARRGARLAAAGLALAALIVSGRSVDAGSVSGSFSETGTGARALGMGEAFVALSDDAYAMNANVAGIGNMDRISATFDYSDLYGLGLLKQSYFGVVVPTRYGVHGFSYTGLQVEFSPFPQKLSETTLGYSYARAVGPLSVGTTVKYMDLTSDFAQGTGTGLGLDVGAKYQWTPRLALGVSIRNLYASVKYGTGTTETIPTSWRIGAAYRMSDRWTLAAEYGGISGDFFSRFRAGTEYWVMRPAYMRRNGGASADSIFKEVESARYPFTVALRAGLEKQFTGAKRVLPAVGTTLGMGSVRLDYAYMFGNRELGETNRFSLTYDFAPWENIPEGAPTPVTEQQADQALAEARAEAVAAAAVGATGIAVLDFANATGDDSLGWLELGLADIVARELTGSGQAVVDRSALAGTANLAGPEIQSLAGQIGARLVVRGIFVRTGGGRMALTVRILDGASGRTLDYVEAESAETDIFAIGRSVGQGIAAKAAAWSY